MQRITLLIIVYFLFTGQIVAEQGIPQHIDITVAQDGSGDFKSLTEAVDALPMYTYERIVIFVKNGVYEEKIRIEQNHITILGESRENTIIQFFQPRPDWESQKDAIGPAVINIHADDLILRNLTIINTQPRTDIHAFAIYGTGTRIILDNCAVKSRGGDTLALWNYKSGMYYHSNCYFEGAVDFVCPRGWCYITDSDFYEVRKTAAIWHAAVVDERQKMVIRNSNFAGVDGFYLGRHHYEAQFFLLDCIFSDSMIDKAIYREINKKHPEKNPPYLWGDRYYYFNCHRKEGDFSWFADNLDEAGLRPDSINPAWAFEGRWNPEEDTPLQVRSWKLDGNDLYLEFDELLTIRGEVVLEMTNGEQLRFREGRGRSTLRFSATTPPEKSVLSYGLKLTSGAIIANQATLHERKLVSRFLLP